MWSKISILPRLYYKFEIYYIIIQYNYYSNIHHLYFEPKNHFFYSILLFLKKNIASFQMTALTISDMTTIVLSFNFS